MYCKRWELYCRGEGSCVAIQTDCIVLQDGCRRPKCVAIQNCIVIEGRGAGRAGVRQTLGMRGHAGGRCRQLGVRAQGAAGVRSWLTHGRRSARLAGRAGRAAGWARGARSRRGAAWQAVAGARGAASWAASAHLVCSTGPGWGFVHPDSVFGSV